MWPRKGPDCDEAGHARRQIAGVAAGEIRIEEMESKLECNRRCGGAISHWREIRSSCHEITDISSPD